MLKSCFFKTVHYSADSALHFQGCALQCITFSRLCIAVHCISRLCIAVHYIFKAVHCSALQCSTVQYSALHVHCSAVQCITCALQCAKMWLNAANVANSKMYDQMYSKHM